MPSIQHGKNVSRRSGNPQPKKGALKWVGFGAIGVILAFGITIVVLNLMTYSPSGLVQGYLSALAKGDSSEATNYPGAELSGSAAQYASDASLSDIHNIQVVSDTAQSDGTHQVTASYILVDLEGNETPGETTFTVTKGEKIYGIFDAWEFTKIPTATVEVTVSNDWRFNLNKQQVAIAGGVPNEVQQVQVLVPNLYQVEHVSNYFASTTEHLAVTTIGQNYQATLALEPTEEFAELIRGELNTYLEQCATQTVLQPTGCPFGKYLSDTVVDDPQWSIAQYPDFVFENSDEGWLIPPAEGTAALVVTMKSIFDGKEYPFNDTIGFTLSYLIQPDDTGNFRIIEQQVG